MHEVVSLRVGSSGGSHRIDDGELVGLSGQRREMPREFDVIDIGVDRLGWSLILVLRLGVEGIEVGHPSIHIEVDDVSGGIDARRQSEARSESGPCAVAHSECADSKECFRGSFHEPAAV